MENLLNQMRVKFTGAEDKKADPGGSRDKKLPTQKTQPSKEKKKALNWFQKQFSKSMSRDDDSREMDHAAAVAAAAFAIDSKEESEQKKSETPEAALTKTKSKVDGTKSPISLLGSASKRLSGSFRSMDDQGKKVPISSADEKKPEKAITPSPSMKKTSTFTDKKPETLAPTVSPPPPPPPPIRQTSKKPSPVRSPTLPTGTKRQTSTGPGIGEKKADEWERTELEKIRKRVNLSGEG